MLASIRDALTHADPAFVGLALAVYAASVPLVAVRWRTVLRGVTSDRLPLGSLILASLASSFVNNVTPAARLSGEACRVFMLVRLQLATVSKATAAAAYERLTEIPSIAAIAVVTLVVVGRNPFSPVLLAAVGLVLVGVVMMRRTIARGLSRLRERWHRLEAVAIAPSALVMSALVSAVVWALDVLRLRLVAAAFRAPIGLPEAAMLAAITIVGSLVPTIGGLGAIEGGLVAGLVALGVRPADAVAITAVERGISYGVATLAGFGALSLVGGRSVWTAVRIGRPAAEGAAT